MGFPGSASGKEPTCQCRETEERWLRFLGWEDPLEEGRTTHFCILGESHGFRVKYFIIKKCFCSNSAGAVWVTLTCLLGPGGVGERAVRGYDWERDQQTRGGLDCEEDWAPKNWCFWTVVLEKTLESPLDYKEIQPVHSEGDQPWDFFGRNDAKAETPVLWPPHVKSWLIG